MAPIFVNDYKTIKSSPPPKDRDDGISFGNNTKTNNGYSIVRSVMVAVIIAIVAVVGVVTLHQSSSPSVLSIGADSLMSSSTMAVASEEDHSGYSNSDHDEFDLFLATLSEEETQMTVIDTSLDDKDDAKDDSASILNQCGNRNNLGFQFFPSGPGVTTRGCAFMHPNGRIGGQVQVRVQNRWRTPITISNGSRGQTFSLVGGGTLVWAVTYVRNTANPRGRVTINMTHTRPNGSTTFATRFISGLPTLP